MLERTLKRPFEDLECGFDNYTHTSALIESTFKDAWLRFSEWNLEDSRKTIESLRAPSPRRRNPTIFDNAISPVASSSTSNETAEDTVSVFQFDEEGATVTVSRPVHTVRLGVHAYGSPESLSTPAYESCSPISRNINVGDDPIALPFLPFADDPDFNLADYADKYEECAWHHPCYMIDPGEAFVTVQVVRRLVEGHGLTAEEIESTGMLPVPLLKSRWWRGILYKDTLGDWFQKFECLEIVGRNGRNVAFLPRTLLVEKQLSTAIDVGLPGLNLFCNGLSCLVSCCATHLDELPPPPSTAPTVTNSQILDNTIQPCGRQCFLFYPSSLPTNWTTEEQEILEVVLRFSPDTSPCDLAVICNKPCFETSRRRRKLINDKDIEKTVLLREQRTSATSSLKFQDDDPEKFTPNPPCSHEGPCTEQTGCACFLNDAHCERACRCNRSCPRRWKGCQCHGARRKRRVCGEDTCPCLKSRRECDPELCFRCEARGADLNRCKNVAIQLGLKKAVEVKESAWGLGCFLLEPVKKSEFIIEYVGELILEPTTLSRDDVSSHRKRSYLFALNESVSIDATYAGNEARFINHDIQLVNCSPRVKLVNGEHRIGIHARRFLEAGTELFLDYGPEFFRSDMD